MDQAQEQSGSIRERIGNLLTSPVEQPKEPVQEASQEAVEPPVTGEEAPQTPETEEAQEAKPADDWAEVELDGETLQVPPKFAKAFMQERDYTQKRQADAELRKVVEIRAQGIEFQAQAMAQLQPLYAQGQVLQNHIQSYEKLDWETLRQQDPLEYSTRRADYTALVQQRDQLARQIEQGQGYLKQQREQALSEATKAAIPIIKKAIPDWGAEKDSQLTKFALQNGATPEELTGLAVRPWAVVLLEKARKYDELQASRAQLPKKAPPLSPVAKPGAKPTVQSAEGASYRKNIEQFRKSGGKDKGALRALLKAKLST